MKTTFLAAAAALAVAAPAVAQEPAFTPTPTKYFFDCNADAALQNLTSGSTTWSPTAPTSSYQSATGCLHVEPGPLVNDPAVDMFLGGSHAGEVKQLELNLFSQTSGAPYNGALGPKSITVSLSVAGKPVLEEVLLTAPVEAGTTTEGKKYTFVVPELDIPASVAPKQFDLQIGTHFSDDATPWTWGAKEFPAGITFYDAEDLPEPEPEFEEEV